MQDEAIFNPKCTTSAACAGENFVNNTIIKSEEPAAGYTNMPKTFLWYNHKPEQSRAQTADKTAVKLPPKRNQLAETGTTTSRLAQVAKGGRVHPTPNRRVR